ncbi:hypothetical protein J1614_004103 [Plenodomus biglobosus]|nr:hypothetical protein J1614_004103 [Plenodomus biglobosus]
MAILDAVPGLEVAIYSNNNELREYEDPSTDKTSRKLGCYIEAQSGATFEIRYSFKSPFPEERTVAASISIDGEVMDEPLIRPCELFQSSGHVSAGPITNRYGTWTVQPYRFSPLCIRKGKTDQVSEELAQKRQSIGVITCRFYFLKSLKRNHHARSMRKGTENRSEVSGKAVKGEALSHQTILGRISSTNAVEYFDVEYTDHGEPFATFNFYYRSLAALKDLQIVKRTPDPIDALNDDEGALAQLNREQLPAIVRHMQEREEARLQARREESESTAADSLRGAHARVSDEEPDFIETGSVDLRAKKRRLRARELLGRESEVVELD